MDGLSGEYTITALSFCLKAGQLCYTHHSEYL